MKEYFSLQLHLLNRRFRDNKIEPLIAWPLALLAFVLLSILLFQKTEFAGYLYLLISLSITGQFSETRRNEFLKICFAAGQYRKIRMLENFILSLPFLLFLLAGSWFVYCLMLLIFTQILALINFKSVQNFTLPTPFSRMPFEFTVGFRNTVLLIFLAYILAGIAVYVGNFNLGIFALLLVFGISMMYYPKPEDEFYVWSFALTPGKFLLDKLKIALIYSSMLLLPVVLILIPVYYAEIPTILMFLAAGYAFLACVILAKYAAYPHEMGIIPAVLMAFCFYFPPMLLVFLPFFYVKSVNHLRILLK